MKKILGVILITVLALSFTTGIVTAAPSGFVNPSFEAGNFSGWNVTVPPGGYAAAVTSYGGYSPAPLGDNHWFAVLKTDGPASHTIISRHSLSRRGTQLPAGLSFKPMIPRPTMTMLRCVSCRAAPRLPQSSAAVSLPPGQDPGRSGNTRSPRRALTPWRHELLTVAMR